MRFSDRFGDVDAPERRPLALASFSQEFVATLVVLTSSQADPVYLFLDLSGPRNKHYAKQQPPGLLESNRAFLPKEVSWPALCQSKTCADGDETALPAPE